MGFWQSLLQGIKQGKEKSVAARSATTAKEARRSDPFLDVPPILTGWPSGFELKKLERGRDCWTAHYGKVGQIQTIGSARITASTRSFSVYGGTVHVNGR